MMVFNQINPTFFFGALFLGIFFSYITAPEPTVIIKYPTPYNFDKVTYKDKSGVCYKYKMNKVYCPTDDTQITNVTIQ